MVLVGAAPASAHASLVSSSPTSGSVVERAPKDVRLTFSEPVEVTRDGVEVTAPDGTALPHLVAGTDPRDRSTIVTKLPSVLAGGTYRVSYRILSIDGHAVQGEIRFAYKNASGSLAASSGHSSSGPSAISVTWRALAAGGALALAGLVAYSLLIVAAARRSLPDSVGRALDRESLVRLRVPVLVALGCGLVGALLTAIDTVSQTTGTIRVGDVTRFLTSTRTGGLLSLRFVLLLVAAGLVLAAGRRVSASAPRGADVRVLAALVAAVLVLVTLALSSHGAAAPVDVAVAIGFDTLHLAAVGLWIGGLLGLSLIGIPAARAAGAGRQEDVGDAAAALARSFSFAAQLAMLVVLTTGGYLALLQVTAVRQLTTTTWGEALTIKVALWVTVLMVATINAVTLVPRMSDRAARTHQRWAATEKLTSAMRVELVGGLVLVSVAAVMAASPPPSSVAGTSDFATAAATTAAQRSTSAASGGGAGYDVRVRTTRVIAQDSAATVFRVLLSSQGTPASAPSADAVLRGRDGIDRRMSLQLVGAGEWLSDRLSVAPGRYRLTTRFLRAGDEVVLPVRVQVP
ncbi:MAG: copper resistance protein CopC [Marmoricola sp.]